MSTATTNKSQPADPLLIATISESGVHNWTWTDSHPLLTRANLRYTSDLAGSLAKFSNYVRNSYRSVPLEDIKAAASQGVELAWYSMLFTQVESWLSLTLRTHKLYREFFDSKNEIVNADSEVVRITRYHGYLTM
ncbi:hypothetical protein TREMEDRAFT_58593 [Tremella mesenterica DSM 1558]|uniref:uncharacterized protein n=1 Tax=Tremella mesenterica (strain ATCC 24925 / CBS 8224 / DSM 1558 / NBRC 9311 / NRRL Y-6157 / RJB 2259-6 / UBC 559-6) TaxID=578456 RepID=UPI0003F4A400|nr:uncharacterized protein TREMEDRAFT_58593 [Tremella mesenterica DSM 1558]EIW72431.1 hypothetical protein TREMEDRAFT_58593 [Tremella mesenterica DSM 1558]